MLSRALFVVVFSLLMLSVAGPVPVAEAQTISQQQLEQLRNLTPAQRKQLMQALGVNTSSKVEPEKEASTPQEIIVPIKDDEELARDVLRPGDFLVVELSSADEESIKIKNIVDALGRNVYEVDADGEISIGGANGIVVYGLTVEQTELRLSAEPRFRNLNITVYRLPVRPRGSLALKRFGSELFKGSPTTYAPGNSIPVPIDYVVGPGDTISLLLYGQLNVSYQLTVNRDGTIFIPEIGPIAIAGMRFVQLREELTKRIQERYIGVDLSIAVGDLRSVQVFVLGDVRRPGSYTVSGLSNMSNVLFVSGGIAESGSMREIQLKRRNKVIGTLDLYDFLLRGNTLGDLKIRSGDVIYVPPVGPQVSVFGYVSRPAIYELKGRADLAAVIAMAGGVLPSSDKSNVKIERFTGQHEKSLQIHDLNQSTPVMVQDGDRIELLAAASPVLGNAISLVGHVDAERSFQWRPGIRLLDVISRPEQFLTGAEQNYLLVERTDESSGRVSLISVDWRLAFQAPGSEENVSLQPKDIVHVFDLSFDRAARISPMLSYLEGQADGARPNEVVSVQGRVRAPGKYPYQQNMRISDLLRAAGSLLENAYLEEAEVTRIRGDSVLARTEHISVSLINLTPGSAGDLELRPSDVLMVREVPLWREERRVRVLGEVAFPGTYSAIRGERLSSVIQRAGGLTDMAFIEGTVFLREELKKREREQLNRLRMRLQTEVAALDDQIDAEASMRGQALLNRLTNTEAVGRLVIDLNLALVEESNHDIILEDGDTLIVPPRSQEVTVIGEVQYPTSHIYERNVDHFSYINKSGGMTTDADLERIYVIRANGNVVVRNNSKWFRRPASSAIPIMPGDTIVVPFDADRVGKLALWTSVTQILYNIGIAAAAVASF